MFLVYVGMFWAVVLFFDTILSSCLLPPYIKLKEVGLSIKAFSIHVNTTRWNRCLQKWSCRKPRLQKMWFDVGTVITCIILPISIYMLLKAANQMLNVLYDKLRGHPPIIDSTKLIMQPVLPGINIPIEESLYYVITLLICSVIHELGHAIAATREDVRVQSFGFFFTIIFPGAYVDLPNDQLAFLSPWQKLRIFTAGVWHNVCLAALAAALLSSTPFLSLSVYKQGIGVTILHVSTSSGAYGEAGLKIGDVVTSLSNCPVQHQNSWLHCLKEIAESPQKGVCVPNNSSWETDKKFSRINCCSQDSGAHLCFQELEHMNFYCLKARNLLESGFNECITGAQCAKMEHCLKPIFDDNSTRLITIKRHPAKDVLFVGPAQELYQAVSTLNYVSRHWLSPRIIYMWETFLRYIIAFSGALAILNVVPCFYLDGQHIMKSFVDYFLGAFISSIAHRNFISTTVTWFGSILLVTVVLLGAMLLVV